MKAGLTAGLALVLALCCLLPAAHSEQKQSIVPPGEQISLEGTKRGPHYIYMTREERARYIKYLTTHPEGRKIWAGLRQDADRTIAGDAENQWALTWAWLVTRERKYFDAVRNRLVAAARRDLTKWPTAMAMAKWGGPGNYFIWGKSKNASYYDLLAQDLSDEDEKVLRGQMKRYCDALYIWYHDRENVKGQGVNMNMSATTIGTAAPQWFAIGYDKMIDWSINHQREGGRTTGGPTVWARAMLDRRVWPESPGYHWLVCMGISALAEMAWRYDGRDVWSITDKDGRKPRDVVDGIVSRAFPLERTGNGLGSIRAPNYGEGGSCTWVNHKDGAWSGWNVALRSVYRASKDKGYGWLASVNRGIGDRKHWPWRCVTPGPEATYEAGWNDIDIEGVEPPPAPCGVFRTAGIAMLRADESPNYWMERALAMLVMGGEPRRSAPGDSFSIMLHGAGRFLYPYWGLATYEDYSLGGWNRSGIHRNSAMIDGRETWRHRSIWRRAFWPEVKYLSVRASRYGHDRSERAFMMTKEYLLDVFDMVVKDDLAPEMHFYQTPPRAIQYRNWSGAGLWNGDGKMPESHTFDYTLHGIGQQFASRWWEFTPSSEITTENWPNRWFENEMRCAMGGSPFHADWVQRKGTGDFKSKEWLEDRAAVRMHMLGSPDTTVFTLRAPMRHLVPVGGRHDDDPEGTIKTLIVRRRGKAARFSALHEPYREKPSISRFEYLHEPEVNEKPRTVAFKVTGPGYRDRLYLTLGLEGMKGTYGKKVEEPKKGKSQLANLTVDWLFKKDPGEVGQKERWFDVAHDRTAWRKANAGINWQEFEEGYYGAAWYAKTLEPVELPPGKKLYLYFEGVDEDCWIYIDGKMVYHRVAEKMGDLWDRPILLEVTDTWTGSKRHQLAVKVRKMKYQTGIYAPVRLMVDSTPKEPAPDPEVTVVSASDSDERVTFRGQAYLRETGKQLIARGDIAGFSVLAPDVKKVIVNGREVELRRAGGYVLYGDVKKPSARAAPAGAQPAEVPAPGRALAAPSVEVSLPQQYVNIDAAEGGMLVVRLTNRSEKPQSGTVLVKPGAGLKAGAARSFADLPPAHRIDLGIALKPDGAESGVLVPVEVIARAHGGAHSAETDVAVGVVIEEVPATYTIPHYDYSKGAPGMPGRPKPKTEWPRRVFDYIQVRAPAYTVRIDKFSGGSRWIMDPTGIVRTKMAGHRMGMARGDDARYGRRWHIVHAPGFGWFTEAKFLGISRDDAGNPTARFARADGNSGLTYVFTASRVTGVRRELGSDRYYPDATTYLPGPAEPVEWDKGLGFEMPEDPWWQEKPVSIWPAYEVREPASRAEPPGEEEERQNLLTTQLAFAAEPPEGVYLDEEHALDGMPSLCLDLDELRGKGGRFRLYFKGSSLELGRKYRFVVKMRHENVANLPVGEIARISGPLGVIGANGESYNAESNHFCDAQFWPERTREWFPVFDRAVVARGGTPRGRIHMNFTMRLPGAPEQTGKIWLGAFRVEEAD